MRFNHVTLIVSDLERSMAFYQTLGLVPIVHAPPRYVRFVFPDGDETLSLEVTGEERMPARAQLFFECADLDQRVAELEGRGVVFTQAPTDMPYLWREARLLDPDGHDVRLYFAGENRLDPPWKLK